MAIIAGFERCRGTRVVTLDADLQNPPEEIGKLLAAMDAGHDYVGGVRRTREDSWWRRTASRLMNRLRERITRIRMTDQGCMLRAYSRDIVQAINECREVSTFIPALAYSFATNPAEVEVAHEERAAGVSKYSYYRLLRLNFDLITGFSLVPLQLFSLFGMGRECLANAVASVAQQTHRPLELIVVDATGGSHPPLPDVPTLTRVRLVNVGRRLLRPAAANVGIDHAQGEWIGFLDDDDFFEPTHVARLLARAAEPDRPRLVHAQLWGLDRFHRVAIQRDTRVNPLIMYYNCQIAAMSCIVHRSLTDAGIRLDETLETNEDWDLWLRLMLPPISNARRVSPRRQTVIVASTEKPSSKRRLI